MKGSIDTEWVAFLAGRKPALRRTVDASQAEALEARLRAAGACVVRAPEAAVFGGRAQVVVYAAKTMAEAEALREAEATLLPGTSAYVSGAMGGQLARHREVGARLGFPACCVEAFCRRLTRGVDTLADGSARGLAEDYVAVRDAWVARADARLNHLLFRARVQLVSFYPCRYDCAEAIAYADGVLAAVRARHGDNAAREIVTALARPVVIAPDGARAWVDLDASGEHIVGAAVITDDTRDDELARTLMDKHVRGDGAVEGIASGPVAPWLVGFK